MSNQTIQDRYGDPPSLDSLQGKKAKLCEKCKEHGQTVYFFWGGTGVMKKNDPTKEIVLPVEITTGKWHECPYREEYNPQGSGGSGSYTMTTTPIPQPQSQQQQQQQPSRAQQIQENTVLTLIQYMQSIVDQNKQIMTYLQSLTASNNHAVEYLETIANSLKSGPQRLLGASFDNVNTGEVTSSTFDTNDSPASGTNTINLVGSKEDEDARIEKEYKEYKEKFG